MRPETEDAVAAQIAAAKGPLRIEGGGTRPIGRPVDGDVLSLAGLSGITLYEPGALTLVAKAGTPLAEVEAALDAERQMLAFEPSDMRRLLGTEGVPTIGGVVACNVSGPRRVSAVGACRDSLLGVRFVDGAGTVLKNGGRVMKNVTGYDLTKMMCGAYGTLGALTEVSLKVLPRPDAAVTVTIAGLDAGRAVAAMSAALTTPFEVTGAFYGPFGDGGTLHLRVEGMEGSVAYRAGALVKELAAYGAATVESDGTATLWADIRDMAYLAESACVTRTALRPSQAAAFIAAVDEGAEATHYLDWGGGLIWSGLDVGAGDAVSVMHGAAARLGGHTTVVKAPEDLRRSVPSFQPQNPTVTALSEGLRAKFDPRGILNPGVMT
ncbi:FAD-binding protein [uncultured Sulfitobacter sp.]|uniref:FAD-binding protein n=1 Tax=uncultured Sulfitobacter sp. TaxID=191468 RepID=UPI00261B5A80|nr:FAD-binding protein [uncultured Sulfitobacter sp.]